jgi:hypothetical protein
VSLLPVAHLLVLVRPGSPGHAALWPLPHLTPHSAKPCDTLRSWGWVTLWPRNYTGCVQNSTLYAGKFKPVGQVGLTLSADAPGNFTLSFQLSTAGSKACMKKLNVSIQLADIRECVCVCVCVRVHCLCMLHAFTAD